MVLSRFEKPYSVCRRLTNQSLCQFVNYNDYLSKTPVLISLVCILVSQGCSNKEQTGWPKIFFHSSGTRSLKSRHLQGGLFLQVLKSICFMSHLQLLMIASCLGFLEWQTHNCSLWLHPLLAFPHVYTCIFTQISYKKHQSLDFMPT